MTDTGLRPDRRPHCARRGRRAAALTDVLDKIAICAGLATWDAKKLFPYHVLERRPREGNWRQRPRFLAREIRVEPGTHRLEHRQVGLLTNILSKPRCEVFLPRKPQAGERGSVACQQRLSNGEAYDAVYVIAPPV